MNKPFQNGATWLRADFHLHTRADFHLHTRADKKFKYSGEDDRFITDYVEALEKAGIQIGVITNHNKFNSRCVTPESTHFQYRQSKCETRNQSYDTKPTNRKWPGVNH